MTFVELTVLVVLIGLGTYLMRMVPFVLVSNLKLPDWFDRYLQKIPHAVMGALIFPGILYVDDASIWPGLLGGVAAIAAVLLTRNVMATVLIAIAVAVGTKYIQSLPL